MRICIIGKFPPIQGGVSMRTYLTAHGLAARGHEVHVVTNAKEVRPPFRMHMREQDWQRCTPTFGAGAVTVHWSDPVDRSQAYIPMASPFVSKLATLAAAAHAARPFDVIYSHYMEPYGVAGYLTAQMTGVPHVVRMAGSDAGRLWHHPQFETLYDHVLRSAEILVAVGAVADRAVQRGVDPSRIAAGGGFLVPEDCFTPEGPVLDLATLRTELEHDADLREMLWGGLAADQPYFGIYGKLGDNKGSFAVLAAMHRLARAGLDIGLLALAHGRPEIERRFRERVHELGLTNRVLQIPFLPHWRVPEFLRGCLAVCCLEQDFPIGFHSPIIPLEVLLCGRCLVASTEVIRKLPQWPRLPHGYGCVAIEDVNDVETLSTTLAAIVRDPAPAAVVGARGRDFARELQRDRAFPERIEKILEAARRRATSATSTSAGSDEVASELDRFPLTRMVAAALAEMREEPGPNDDRRDPTSELAFANRVLTAAEQAVADGTTSLRSLAQAVHVEIVMALAEDDPSGDVATDPLFRLRIRNWAMRACDLGELRPVRDRQLRVLQFDHDITPLRSVKSIADLPVSLAAGRSHMVVFRRDARRSPLFVDRFTARILELSDGTRTGSAVVNQLEQELGRAKQVDHRDWIEKLFLSGLIELHADATGTSASGEGHSPR